MEHLLDCVIKVPILIAILGPPQTTTKLHGTGRFQNLPSKGKNSPLSLLIVPLQFDVAFSPSAHKVFTANGSQLTRFPRGRYNQRTSFRMEHLLDCVIKVPILITILGPPQTTTKLHGPCRFQNLPSKAKNPPLSLLIVPTNFNPTFSQSAHKVFTANGSPLTRLNFQNVPDYIKIGIF